MASDVLGGVRVLDLTDERAIYGAKLLADLGARVVRVTPPGGCPLQRRGPFLRHPGGAGAAPGPSLWYAFFASNRRTATVAPETAAGAAELDALLDDADVVLMCGEAYRARCRAAQARRPALVVVDVSSFGDHGPWRDCLAPDLIAGALGGAVATTGDAGTAPLKTFGDLNFALSGTYAAIAALAGLRHAKQTGAGQRVGVSVHECIASCLEHVLMWWWYHDRMPNAAGPVLPRRGSLHWSNAYGVMPAADGAIMVTPTPNLDNQLVWLVEEDVHADLLDPRYQEPEQRGAYIRRLMDVLRGWVATQSAEALFLKAQSRHAPYGWVLPVDKVAENPQLQARDWWRPYPLDGANPARGPGSPFRFSGGARDSHPPAAAAPADNRGGAVAPAARDGAPRRPLDGVRVLDFTHVLAGPFATRILADLGADVVKVNSSARLGPNAPDGIYYLMWNRNKRALALDMSTPEGRALCERLCRRADVVIDNFSVGVLERWGVGYESVSARNPGVVYLQMSGMGADGPWSNFVTYAPTIHALAGLTRLTGVPGREDIGIGFSYNDHSAGLHGAVAILAALEARRRTGRGQRVDLSQFEVGVALLGPALMDYFANGRVAAPCGNRLPYDKAAPHGCYPCASAGGEPDGPPAPGASEGAAAARPSGEARADERWVAIACMTDGHWLALRQVLGDPAWARAPGLDSVEGRLACAELDDKLAEWTRTRSATSVMERCQAAGVPAGVVQTGADMCERDPQLKASGFLFAMAKPHPVQKTTYGDRLPLKFEYTPCDEYRRTRRVGEDNAAVLADWLGMTADEVRRGEEAGYLT